MSHNFLGGGDTDADLSLQLRVVRPGLVAWTSLHLVIDLDDYFPQQRRSRALTTVGSFYTNYSLISLRSVEFSVVSSPTTVPGHVGSYSPALLYNYQSCKLVI